MPETDMISVGEPMPRLAAVEPANGPYTVSVIWSEGARAGRTDIIDLARIIMTYKVFKPLRDDRALFETVRLGEWGWSIVWDGNGDLDISADTLSELAAEAMTNHDFVAFMKRHEWTFDVTAAQLGISRRLVAYYAKNREIPRYIMLACQSLDMTYVGGEAVQAGRGPAHETESASVQAQVESANPTIGYLDLPEGAFPVSEGIATPYYFGQTGIAIAKEIVSPTFKPDLGVSMVRYEISRKIGARKGRSNVKMVIKDKP